MARAAGRSIVAEADITKPTPNAKAPVTAPSHGRTRMLPSARMLRWMARLEVLRGNERTLPHARPVARLLSSSRRKTQQIASRLKALHCRSGRSRCRRRRHELATKRRAGLQRGRPWYGQRQVEHWLPVSTTGAGVHDRRRLIPGTVSPRLRRALNAEQPGDSCDSSRSCLPAPAVPRPGRR